jgi:hypothetical protein
MIAVAALAMEFALIRGLGLGFEWDFVRKIWTETRWFFHSWMIDEFIFRLFLLGMTATLSTTLAALIYRLRRPRPRWRRLVRQPGMAAVLTAVIVWLASLPLVVLEPDLGRPAVLAGFGITARWGLLRLSRRWRCEPSWVDRLGRLVGITWIALSLWGIHLRVVC